jgi:hypothetical protein
MGLRAPQSHPFDRGAAHLVDSSAVRRFLALLVVSALTASSGLASLLHTHAYGGHDHPEHHHGIAAHDHHRAAPPADAAVAHLERCDPAKHTIALSFVCAPPHAHDLFAAEAALPTSPTSPAAAEHCARRADVRAHGPPLGADGPPRAPPAIALA